MSLSTRPPEPLSGSPPGPPPEPSIAALNDGCACSSTDARALSRTLDSMHRDAPQRAAGMSALTRERCPHALAASPVFLSHVHVARMAAVVRAVESVARLPAYREEVLAHAPPIAHHDAGAASGVFFGYDFHVAGDGFGLIEINTNAGGAMLNAALARAQYPCCRRLGERPPSPRTADAFERDIVAMFRREWSLAGRERPLRRVAIVDESPVEQYLYPEFLLFGQLFRRHGLEVVIAGPEELELRDGVLRHDGSRIDLVYNRLTDFALDAPDSAVLREAYLSNAVVLTPHPRAHALYADKRNLALLCDAERLATLGVPRGTREILSRDIPRTEPLTPENAERLWATRRTRFFKPFAGYGSRAAYRGDKLTRRVWEEIVPGGHVAQAFVAPGTRRTSPEADARPLKFDLRSYAYDGTVQWTAARLYRGQTTNFRTPDGGFAPVYASRPTRRGPPSASGPGGPC